MEWVALSPCFREHRRERGWGWPFSGGSFPSFPPLLPNPHQLLSPVSGAGRQELLHRVAGEGLAVDYTFSRQPFSGDPHMVSVHIHFSNSSDTPIKGLHVGTPKLPPGISIQEFPEIGAEISTLHRVVEEALGRGQGWELHGSACGC